MARRLGDHATLGFTLNEHHWALYEPSNVEQRLAIADEMLDLAGSCGDHALALKGHRWRIVDLLEMGDIVAMDVAIEAQAALAGELREPLFIWLDAARGRTEDARRALERLAADGFAVLMGRLNRLVNLTLLAEVCAVLADAVHARALYDVLRPYAHRNAVSTGGVITTAS